MVKRKRDEPKLGESLEQWEKSLMRGLKAAKGFERQRLSKRIRDADPDKVSRLEKEIAVLKSLDLNQAAHQHLCSSLLKIKGIAESPNLPHTIRPVPKPNLSEEERIALHNVTSALCNRKQVKDIIEEAIMGVCIALRVSMPEKKGKGKGKKNETQEQEEKPDVIEAKPVQAASKKSTPKKLEGSVSGSESPAGSWGGLSPAGGDSDDSEAEQKTFSRFEGMLGGSSDEDEPDDGASDEEDLQNSRARSIRGPSDHFSGSSADEDDDSSEEEEEEEEDAGEDEESEDEALAPPPKKSRVKAAKAASAAAANGNSTFLPSLMGGYISGSESDASDLEDFAAPKKNRRGQRARQAIWEKKFKEQARHIQQQKLKDSRDDGWDLKRGAVGEEDAGPWKKGVRNPFEKPPPAPEGVHPQRHGNFAREARETRETKDTRETREPRTNVPEERPKPAGPKRDDIGTLHPSWEAARKAKETSKKIAFEGRKIVFD